MPRVLNVRFEHHGKYALGIGEPRPRISWTLEGPEHGWFQRAYEIRVLRANNTELYSVDSEECSLVEWPSGPLRSREAAQVSVRVTGIDGDVTEWSDGSTVEAGILDLRAWNCFVIEPDVPTELTRPIVFEKVFESPDDVSRARLYISAHGLFIAHLNSTRIGDRVLSPGWTSYSHRLIYETHDVTNDISPGTNKLSVTVADGWYKGRLGWHQGKSNIYGSKLGLIAMIVIESGDGAQSLISTDRQWSWSYGPHVSSSLYDGEVFDARLCQEPSIRKPVLERKMSDNLEAPDGPPILRTELITPAAISKSPSGHTLVDMGQNMVGWIRVRLRGPSGNKVSFKFAEVLEKGEIATRTLRAARAEDSVILGSEQELLWEPDFTFHGFRYIQVESWPGSITKADMLGVVVRSDITRRGFFSCSNPLLNKLHDNIVWSIKGNTVGLPTDCPQRDERLGWTGDINTVADTAHFLFDTAGFLKSWLKDLAAEQKSASGIVPLVIPNVIEGFDQEAHAIWGDVSVMLPWSLFMFTGDCDSLAQQFPSMQSWYKSIPRRRNGLWNYRSQWKLGDWLDPAASSDDPGNATTDPTLVSDAFLVHITELLHRVSGLVADKAREVYYAGELSKLRSEFAKEYITPNGLLAGCTQTAFALALHFNLMLDQKQEQHAADMLSLIIRRNSRFRIATGFAGTPFIGHALSKHGFSDIFYRMLLGRENPSWLYPVLMGATTTWERWDSMLPDGSINLGEMTSFNHYAFGAVASWMHRTILGFRIKDPGCKAVQIMPIPGGGLTWAQGEFRSSYGAYKIQWCIRDDSSRVRHLQLQVEVPPNTRAQVWLPCGRIEDVASGLHFWNTPLGDQPWPPKAFVPPGHCDQVLPDDEILACPF